MAKLGFIGLGIMGDPMARQLLKAGHDVGIWSNTAAKASKLGAEFSNAKVFDSPKEVASFAECVFYCVGDSDMSVQVAESLLEGIQAGAVVADCSTIAPEVSRGLEAKFRAKGAFFLDAPCTGSKPGAENGTLTFMVGGDQATFERVKPLFEPMGKLLYYCGGPGMGLHAKLTQNLVLANIMEAFNEGMVLASKAGVPAELMLEILNNSAAKSGLISFKAPYILDRNFVTNFATKWMHKDIGLALETGRQLGVPLPATGLVQQMFQAAISMGYGDEDFCSTVKVLEGWGNTTVKKS